MGLFSRAHSFPGNDDISFVLYPDAGRGNIQAILITHGTNPVVVASLVGKKKLDTGKDAHQLSELLSSVQYALTEGKRLLDAARSRDHKHYNLAEVLIVLPGPYYLLHTTTVRFSSPKPVTVTEALLNDIKKQHNVAPLESAVVGGQAPEDALEIVRNRMISTKVNGYVLMNPIGSVGTDIEMTSATMTVEKEIKEALEKEVKKVFDTKIKLDSVAFASFNVLSQRMHVDTDFLGVVVGVDLSEILFVDQGILKGSISFPFGHKKIIQTIAKNLGLTPSALTETLQLYHDKKLPDAKSQELEMIFAKGSEEWLDAFSKAIIDVLEGMPPPSQIFFIEDTDLSVFFNYAISKNTGLSQIFSPRGFKTTTVDAEELGRGVFKVAPNVFMNQLLSLLALFTLRHDRPVL
jgi:hypothetical protein